MKLKIEETEFSKNLSEMNEELKYLRNKVAIYEGLLHDIQMYAEVVLNEKAVSQLIKNICNWSYSHRVGENITEEEREILIKNAFNNLRNIEKH